MDDCFVYDSSLNEDGKCSICDFLAERCRCLRNRDRNNGDKMIEREIVKILEYK